MVKAPELQAGQEVYELMLPGDSIQHTGFLPLHRSLLPGLQEILIVEDEPLNRSAWSRLAAMKSCRTQHCFGWRIRPSHQSDPPTLQWHQLNLDRGIALHQLFCQISSTDGALAIRSK